MRKSTKERKMTKKLEAMNQQEAQEYMNKLMGKENLEFANAVEASMYAKFKEMMELRANVEQSIAQQRKQIEEGERHYEVLNAQLNVVGNLLIEIEDDRLVELIKDDKALEEILNNLTPEEPIHGVRRG